MPCPGCGWLEAARRYGLGGGIHLGALERVKARLTR
jgi:hypothetical protein